MHFEFFLAEQLHMTVRELRERMDGLEFLMWSRYYSIKAQRAEMERLQAR